MLNPEDLYIINVDALHADLYRMGNSASPNFSEARSLRDCTTVDRNGIKTVIANGNGFSAFTFITADMRKGAKVWRIRKGTPLPHGLRLVKDLTRQGHYMLSPAVDMPLSKFLGFLEEVASNPAFASKLTQQEVMTCPTTPR